MIFKILRRLVFIGCLLLPFPISAENSMDVEYEALAGLSFNNYVGDDADDYSIKAGFNVAFAARCYFYDNLFIESGLGFATKGYKKEVIATSGQYWDFDGPNYDSYQKIKMTSYNLDLPILIGWRFNINDDFNIKLKIGPYLTYALFGEEVSEGSYTHIMDIHGGAEITSLDKTTKLKDLEGFNNFGCGINVGVDFNYKSILLSAKYQRGFTEIFKDYKKYEQNILVSIGYRF